MTEQPLACRLDVFEAGEGARYRELRELIRASSLEVRERDDGYAVRLRPEAAVFRGVAEWITLERRCCPFLSLGLAWTCDDGMWLELTGGPDVKRFLAGALGRTAGTAP